MSTVGIIRASVAEQGRFLAGFEAMVAAVRPERVLIYGKRFPVIERITWVDQVYYDPRRWS